MLPTFCPPTIWAISLEFYRKLPILAADDFLGAYASIKAMTPKSYGLYFSPTSKIMTGGWWWGWVIGLLVLCCLCCLAAACLAYYDSVRPMAMPDYEDGALVASEGENKVFSFCRTLKVHGKEGNDAQKTQGNRRLEKIVTAWYKNDTTQEQKTFTVKIFYSFQARLWKCPPFPNIAGHRTPSKNYELFS